MHAQILLTRYALGPIALHDGWRPTVLGIIERRLIEGVRFDGRQVEAATGKPAGTRSKILSMWPVEAASGQPSGGTGGSIAVIHVMGVIMQRVDDMDLSGPGGTSTERLGRVFDQALSDPSVGTIILNIDSPGGSVYGVEELATKIRAASGGSKPIIAQVNSLAASAAYWIASSADEIVITPSGEVGSIGVYCLHEDISQMLEMKGIKAQFISAGAHKVEGNALEPLSQEAREHMQSRIDDYYAAFTKSVAKGRNVGIDVVRGEQFGEGRCFGAAQAVKRGMANSVATLEQTLNRFGAKGGAKGARAELVHTSVVAEAVDTPVADEPGLQDVANDDTDIRVRRHRKRALTN